MIPAIRLATPEEIEKIRDHSDLTPTSTVWIWPYSKEESPTAVVRNCWEVDPMLFGANTNNQRKVLFAWGLFNMLRVTGINEIYFDVDTEGQEDYIAILEKMGAEKTTAKPQWRFKMIL